MAYVGNLDIGALGTIAAPDKDRGLFSGFNTGSSTIADFMANRAGIAQNRELYDEVARNKKIRDKIRSEWGGQTDTLEQPQQAPIDWSQQSMVNEPQQSLVPGQTGNFSSIIQPKTSQPQFQQPVRRGPSELELAQIYGSMGNQAKAEEYLKAHETKQAAIRTLKEEIVKATKGIVGSGLYGVKSDRDIAHFKALHQFDPQMDKEYFNQTMQVIESLPTEKERVAAAHQLGIDAITAEKQMTEANDIKDRIMTESGLNTRQQKALENAIELEKLKQEGAINLEKEKATTPKALTPAEKDKQSIRNVQIGKLDEALNLVKSNPDLVGPKYLGGVLGTYESIVGGKDQGKKDDLQILVGSITSQLVKELSGSAVGQHELERLKPWLPNRYDRPELYQKKLAGLKRELENTQYEYDSLGNVSAVYDKRDKSYRSYGGSDQSSSSSAPPAQPSGTESNPLGLKGF